MASELPTLQLMLKAIAEAPGSSVMYYQSEHALCKAITKKMKRASKQTQVKIQRCTCVLSTKTDIAAVKSKYKSLYDTPQSFISRFSASPCGAFPGEQE